MRIFDAEREAGLAEVIKANNRVQFHAPAEIVIDEDIIQSIKASNELEIKDPNLSFFRSILASVGWNLNDDVALAEEIWAARHTPEHKPFNFNHDEDDIIGHIVSNFALDDNYKPIDMDTPFEKLPERFHIGTGFVLYSDYWENKDMRQRINTLVEEIKEDKWRVSLEAWIADFDYAIQTSSDGYSVVARSNENAYLTKYLRAFGGNGVYKDARIGRVMRGIRFKGEGLVKRPGNPYSVILNNCESTEIKIMSENTTNVVPVKEIEAVKAEVEKKDALIASLQKKIEEFENKKYNEEITALKAKIAEFEKTVADKDTELNQVKADLTVAKESLTESVEQVTSLKAKLDEIESKRKLEARVNALVSAGLTKEEAEEKAKTLVAASDEIFDTVLSLVKSKEQPAEKKNKGTNPADLETSESVEKPVHAGAGEQTSEDKLALIAGQVSEYFGTK